MLNMCIPIPPCLHPDPICSPETLISGSRNDPILLTPPIPFAAADHGGKEQSELKQDPDGGSGDKAVEEQEFRGGGVEFSGSGEEVLEEKECNGGGEKFLVLKEQEPARDGEKVLEEQELAGNEKKFMEEHEPACDKVLGEQDLAGNGEKFMEEQEPAGNGEKFMEEQEPAGYGEKILEECDHEVVGESGHEVEGDHSEASPSSSPTGFRDSMNYSNCNSDLRFNLSSDLDVDCSETRLRMHNFQSQPPPSQPPVGAGLGNMGNTCFLNAVMQCFTHTVPLVHGLHSLYDYGVPRHHNEGEFCVLSAVRDHVFEALNAPGEVILPDNLVFNLSHISSFLHRYQQEDAHEFLQCLIDKTDTCWSKCKANMEGYSAQGDSLVKRVFGGRLVSQLHCCNCGSRSDTYEAMVDLSLEIEDADDLNGALKSFTKMEENEDEVKFTCEKCKEKVPLKKQLLIDQAPTVATLHLKRFKGDGHYVEKNDKVLEYPLELDLKPYTVDGSEDENVVELTYELYAVIVHRGFSSTSGHYLCYIRSSPDIWFRIDDSKITRVREDAALSQQGYILFYARKGTAWPCSLFKSSSDPYIWKSSPTSVLENVQKQHFNAQVENNSSANMQRQEAICCRNDDEVASTEPCTAPRPSKDHEFAVDDERVPTTGNNSTNTGSKENAVMSQYFKSRSPSPEAYSPRPEAACTPRPPKKQKVVRSVTPPRKGVSLKVREAQRSMRRMPSARRHVFMAVLNRRRSC